MPGPGNHLYYGDNLDVLRGLDPDAFVDLVYLDPPFNSNADYNQLFRGPKGRCLPAQVEAFTDTWQWDDAVSGRAVQDVKASPLPGRRADARRDGGVPGQERPHRLPRHDGGAPDRAHRVLKPTGSLYLHCDPTASHYLKVLLDAVFGAGSDFAMRLFGSARSATGDGQQDGSEQSLTRIFIYSGVLRRTESCYNRLTQ